MSSRPRAVAFDVDGTSLASLREALPGWRVRVVNGATAASLARDWDPGKADLLVVGVRGDGADSFGLCRFLAFCSPYSDDTRPNEKGPPGPPLDAAVRPDAPLLVLVSPDQEALVEAVLDAGAHGCLVLPIHPREVTGMLAHTRAGNQPGRHTRSLDQAQCEDRWRQGGEA